MTTANTTTRDGMTPLGALLEERRHRAGLTQSALVQAMGTTRPRYQRVLTTPRPRLDSVALAAHALAAHSGAVDVGALLRLAGYDPDALAVIQASSQAAETVARNLPATSQTGETPR